MRTYAYIDGFNLYYRAVRSTEFKWLDLGRLIQNLLPNDDIQAIEYFTAHLASNKATKVRGSGSLCI